MRRNKLIVTLTAAALLCVLLFAACAAAEAPSGDPVLALPSVIASPPDIPSPSPEPPAYNCDTPNHNCDGPATHALITDRENKGCPICGSHSCPSFYALDPWGFTKYTRSECPEYDIKNDPVFYCQDCGKKTGDGSNGTCARFISAADCPNCGEYVLSRVCHTCE